MAERRSRLAHRSPIIWVTVLILLLNGLIFQANVIAARGRYGHKASDNVQYFISLLAAVIALSGGVASFVRRFRPAAGLLLAAAVLFFVPLSWARLGGDNFWLWWVDFGGTCVAAAWRAWALSRGPISAASARAAEGAKAVGSPEGGGPDLVSWKRFVKITNVLLVFWILGSTPLYWILRSVGKSSNAFVWTFLYLLGGIVLVFSLRADKRRRLGLSPKAPQKAPGRRPGA